MNRITPTIERIFNTRIKKMLFIISICVMILSFAGAALFYEGVGIAYDSPITANLLILGLLAPTFVLLILTKEKRLRVIIFAVWFWLSMGVVGVLEAGLITLLIGGLLPATLWAGYSWIKGAK